MEIMEINPNISSLIEDAQFEGVGMKVYQIKCGTGRSRQRNERKKKKPLVLIKYPEKCVISDDSRTYTIRITYHWGKVGRTEKIRGSREGCKPVRSGFDMLSTVQQKLLP